MKKTHNIGISDSNLQLIKPSVAVILLTNSEAPDQLQEYIMSILQQQISFRVTLFIIHTGSINQAADVCQELAAIYPDKIKFYIALSPKDYMSEITIHDSFVIIGNSAERWMNPEKLQQQYDFLDNNRRYTVCFHNIQYAQSDTEMSQTAHSFTGSTTNTINLSTLFRYYSPLFKAKDKCRYSLNLFRKDIYQLFANQVYQGKVRCLPDIMIRRYGLNEQEKEELKHLMLQKRWHYHYL